MTKEEIDAIIQIIEKMAEAESDQQFFDEVKELCSACKSEDLWGEIQKKQNDAVQGNEEAENEVENLLQQLMSNIHSQIPENLLDYFYIELMNKGLDDMVLNDEQKEKAEEAYDKYVIEEIIELDEDARIQASKRIRKKDTKLKILKTLSDEKKIEALKGLANERDKIEVIKTIEDVSKKIEALKELTGDYSKAEVIKTIEDPSKKIEALKELVSDYSKAEVIKTIEDSSKKIEALKELTDEGYKAEVIQTIEDPSKKIEALKELTDERYKFEIIKAIEDPERRLGVALKELWQDDYKVQFIQEIEDPEIRLEVALKELWQDEYKFQFILGIKDSERRLEVALKELTDEGCKFQIIKAIEDPDRKLEVALKELTDERYKFEIIKAIEDPSKKIEALKKLTDELYKFKIIQTIEDASKKIEALKELTNEMDKLEIIQTIEDPDRRLEVALKELTDEENKVKVIQTINDPRKKIEALKKLTNEYNKVIVIRTIEDSSIKIEALKELTDEESKVYIIRTIKDPEIRLEVALKELTSEYSKVEVIKTIEDPEQRLKIALKELRNDYYKIQFIQGIKDSERRLKVALKELTDDWSKAEVINTIEDEVKLQILEELEGQEWFLVAENLKDENKLEVLSKCDENGKLRLIRTIQNPEIMLEALDELEGEYKEVLKKLYTKNNDVVKNIDVRILDECYLKTLGEDKINLISCFPDVQAKILNLSEKEYEIFAKCLNSYVERAETDEWTTVATYLLENLQNGEYSELINNIEDIEKVDIEKLSKILQLTNDFGIRTVEDIDNYEEIKKKKCDEIIKSEGNIEEKKKAVLLKLFGQDMEYTKTILTRYGEDISSIEDGEEKDFVIALQEIMEIENEDILRQIYEECEEIGILDKTIIERDLKTAYWRKFNEGLYEIKFEDIIEEKDLPEELRGLNLNVYDAGTDFKMIITSIAPYIINNPADFKKDWNRPAIGSQHFCASYIRNDMIGLPPVPHLCYGFSQMKEDSLMLSGPGDIWSSGQSFVSKAHRDEKYYSPDKQINSTVRYNEMDFRRIQGGVKKQPDYIVAFKRNGVIPNIEEIKQAIKDWGEKLPIVIVDVDKCLEAEKGKVEELLRNYNSSKNPETAREMLQKVRNNKVTDRTFGSKLEEQLKEIEQEIASQEQNTQRDVNAKQAKSELAPVYDSVSAQERQEGVKVIKQLREKIQAMKKESEKVEQ